MIALLKLSYKALSFIILFRVIISWIPSIDIYKQPYKTIVEIADYILNPIREFMDKSFLNLPVDISPIIAIFLIRFLYGFILGILF